MEYHAAAAAVALAAWAGLFCFYYHRRGKRLKQREIAVLWLVAAAGMVYSYCTALYYQLSYINCLRNALVFGWLWAIALIDGREKLIPRALTTSGLACWAAVAALAVLAGGDTWKNVLWFSGGGLLLGGGVFLVCRFVSRGGIGMGDIRMFSVLGLLYGVNYTFSILFVTILLMAVFGVAGILFRKTTAKSMVPMGPFALAAVSICFWFGI